MVECGGLENHYTREGIEGSNPSPSASNYLFMLVTSHAIIGSTLPLLIPNPYISIPLCFVSHFFLDMIPHWQVAFAPYKSTQFAVIGGVVDLMLGISFTVVLSMYHPDIASLMWLGAMAGMVPDIDTILPYIFPAIKNSKIFKFYWDWHCKIQYEINSVWGVVTKFVLLLSLIFIVIK